MKMEVSNNLLAVLVIVAMAVSIAGTTTMLSLTPGQGPVITGMAQTTQQGTATVEVPAEANIYLSTNTVDFGEIDAVAGAQNDTMDDDPAPLVIENNGTVEINISIAESTSNPLWGEDDNCESCFSFNVTNGSAVALWTARDTGDWTNFEGDAEAADAASVNTDDANIAWNLSESDSEDELEIELNITVPPGESAGVKTATLFFKAAAGA